MHTISDTTQSITEIKKSRFITWAAHVQNKQEAIDFLDKTKDPTASHNCWAYKIEDSYRFSDDGEPGGTAGKPILCAIEGSGLDYVVVVVIRFFGGIKLGAGGLVRAYSNATATCLGTAEKREIIKRTPLKFHVSFGAIGSIYPLLEKFDIQKEQETYTDNGVHFSIAISQKQIAAFQQEITNATHGSVVIDSPTQQNQPKSS